jgi:EAL domain-containing protein (putative c-di-GMP-specific phosphodiesterase class I)
VRQVVEPGLAAKVKETLEATHLDPSCLWLVLTETALMRAGHSASVELTAVEALGVHLGLDDFGAGNASPTNLQRLPIDFLKIGPSFVANLNPAAAVDANGNAIFSALTELGRGLKLRTVADGIRRTEELALVRAFGCRYGQGDLLACAVTGEELTPLLTTPGATP